MAGVTSCGVVVTDGSRVLLGHATRSPRWDIPKGIAEANETFSTAAARELAEETGLLVPIDALHDLGVHDYLPRKNLALFLWVPAQLPLPDTLLCRSTFVLPDGTAAPEFDRFGVFQWSEALAKVGSNLRRVLKDLRPHIAAMATDRRGS